MVEQDPQGPPPNGPRVVKKVVKRTVVRPAPPGTARPGGTATKPRATAVSRVTKTTTTTAPGTTGPTERTRPARPSIDVGRRVTALRTGSATALRTTGGVLRRTGGTLRDVTTERASAARAWRVPTVSATRAALITGLLVGLLITTLGWLAMSLFSRVLGTPAGGGLWGGLAVLATAAAAFAFGSWLLSAFGSPQARLTEGLSLLLVLLAILVAFLDLAAGAWAWLLLPALGALTHLVAVKIVAIAETEGQQVA